MIRRLGLPQSSVEEWSACENLVTSVPRSHDRHRRKVVADLYIDTVREASIHEMRLTRYLGPVSCPKDHRTAWALPGGAVCLAHGHRDSP